jgi:hypothetical protein
MRARKGSHQLVYTHRGYDPDHAAVEGSIALAVEEQPADFDVAVTPARVCPHGGIYRNGLPVCGECFQQPHSGYTPEDSWNVFVMSLYDVCQRVARSTKHYTKKIELRDRVQHCILALLQPQTLKSLQRARNPYHLAYDIADKRLIDLERNKVFRHEFNTDFDPETNSELEKPSRSEREEKEYAIRHGAIRVFPGVKLLWTAHHIDRLMRLVAEAMDALPREPFSYSTAVSLHTGFWGEQMSWPELARHMSQTRGRPVSVKQVRLAVETSLATMRRHLLRNLTPDMRSLGL